MPVIVIELFLVLGGVVAFAWWQFRDLDREKKKREARQVQAARDAALQRDASEANDAPDDRPRGPDHAA